MPVFRFLLFFSHVLIILLSLKTAFMRKSIIYILLVACAGITYSCKPGATSDAGKATLSKDSLVKHIAVLASDAYGGRRPFTDGEKKTIAYLENECRQMGLEPGNGNSYLQEVPMVEITPVGTPSLSVQAPKGNINLRNMEDFVIFTENTDTSISIDKADLIFAGFGVVAPEYNWNDYAGLDVKGKVVMVMVNDPGFTINDTSLFKGNTMTYYGRWTYKFEEAARQGARGCLIVHNTEAASYPFTVVQNSNGSTKLHLDTRNNSSYHCPIEGWVTEEAAKKILATAGKDSSVFVAANKRGFKPMDLHTTVSAHLQTHVVFNTSHNVIAKISGSKRPNEYIIYTAHWDHFGIGKPDEHGDSIYNGALDNASGTAAVLEIARSFASLPEKPERSIAFLFVTAEEQGLLGSKYYTEHPVYPAAKTVANINIDVISANGRTKDVSISGAGQSDLEDDLAAEVKKQGRYIAPESHPEAGHYFRSDHFNFAKAGVPALTAGGGVDNVEKGKAYGEQKENEYTEKYYHRPDDEYSATLWNFDGAMEDMQLLFRVGHRLAYSDEWPKWKSGSEFRAIREKSGLQ